MNEWAHHATFCHCRDITS